MSTAAPEPVPQRIGDAERDQAAGLLREHLAAGRITAEEFDERLTRALSAKTMADLRPLFGDLPGPRPGDPPVAQPVPAEVGGAQARQEVAPRSPGDTPASNRAAKAMSVIAGVSWPLIFLLIFAIGWEYWFLIFIPIALSSVAGSLSGKSNQERGELEQ